MKQTVTMLLVFGIALNAIAQNKIAGDYILTGVMETAAAFKLNNDSSFEFYFSYGALDRYGSGKWTVKNDHIIFTGKPSPGKDFKLVNTSAAKEKFSVIRLEDKNNYLYNLVYCHVKNAQYDTILNFDNDGILNLPFTADSIQLLSELCPERISTFALQSTPLTYVFNFEPWIVEVFFDKNSFQLKDEYFEGKFFLLEPDKSYRFVKGDGAPE